MHSIEGALYSIPFRQGRRAVRAAPNLRRFCATSALTKRADGEQNATRFQKVTRRQETAEGHRPGPDISAPSQGRDIKDVYGSQTEVLNAWFADREKPDHVIKLHTGGGKTLVGLLIAQSILNETSEPVIFICPNNHLVTQTLKKADGYHLPAVPYTKPFADDFLNGKSVMVANYSHLFNGISRFGIRGKEILKLGGVIVDDAQVGASILRDQFSIKVEKNPEDDPGCEDYATLTTMFRLSFKETGQLGTFDDVVGGSDYTVLEVPYWTWLEKPDEVQNFLRTIAGKYDFQWPLLRDNLKYCHCFVDRKSVAITPIFPLGL
jgi:replicative superfamily II helicase